MSEENDIALEYNEESAFFDIPLTADGFDLAPAVNLRNAVALALFSERRTNADDDVPNQGGYAGDAMNAIDEDNLGSKLWMRFRGKSLDKHLPEVEEDCKQALQFLIDDKIASTINVVAVYKGSAKHRLRFDVEIVRLTGEKLQYSYVWKQPLFAN